ncbi:MAG: class I SAM-dependent methyltransferase [Nanoarchaeota archaeon]|nr:class I SAM-dependent methyltransferase [Nanoarchaeota archaeon]MBU1005579.1 class I SAM-dependent methyltransferase [Nanoarchaeota archaeon]MBU1945965.1 class I SAM-dependent methyltransferase [Nanoarchaeota archaeon]
MSKSHAVKTGRITKAKKIISILKEYKNLKESRLLDIGVGNGEIANELAKVSKEVMGIDLIDETVPNKKFKFMLVKSYKLPFKDNSLDIIISNHVLEHITNQKGHLEEIKRVLKNNGICYLATPNRYWVFERHFNLPFLSFFPKTISQLYLRLLKNKEYDITLVSFGRLNQMLRGWNVDNITKKILKNPGKYNAHDIPFHNLSKLFFLMPDILIDKLCFFLPSFVLVLRKK